MKPAVLIKMVTWVTNEVYAQLLLPVSVSHITMVFLVHVDLVDLFQIVLYN